jgi:ketosteroid isomerase-like protein
MKRTRVFWVGGALALLAFGSGAKAFGQSASDEVERVINDFLVPFTNRDTAQFIEYFADDATFFFPQGTAGFPGGRIQGKVAIAREFETRYERSGAAPAARPAIRPLDLVTQYFDDFAVVTFHLGTDGQRSRRTFVLQRIDSRWKIVHVHASLHSSE